MPTAHIEPFPPLRGSTEALPSLALRLRVRWNALKLDSALAAGADPGATEQLGLRAKQLAESDNRELVASSIVHVLKLVERGSTTAIAPVRVPFSRGRVEANRAKLLELAERLRDDGPHPVRGLAIANLLLEDGGGPLYVREPSDRLGPAVDAALSALHR